MPSPYFVPPPDYDDAAAPVLEQDAHEPQPDYNTFRGLRNLPPADYNSQYGSEYANLKYATKNVDSDEPLHILTEFSSDYSPRLYPRNSNVGPRRPPKKEIREENWVPERTNTPILERTNTSVNNSHPSPNGIYNEPPLFSTHSYMEDRVDDVPTHARSMRSHIRQIGVPVLPGITPHVFSQSDFVAAPITTDQNKAFEKHLENHRKYDTMKSLRGVRDCPICKMMSEQLGIPLPTSSSRPRLDAIPDEEISPVLLSGSNSKRRGDVLKKRKTYQKKTSAVILRELFNAFEAPSEPAPTESSTSTRAKQDYIKKQEGEITVVTMESVDVLLNEQGYALCRKSDGTIGWLPSNILAL